MRRALIALLVLAASLTARGQDSIGGGLFSMYTSRVRNGTSDPATCQPTTNNIFINRNSTPVLKICTAANTWSLVGTGTITGSTGAADNRILRSDGVGGATLQDSAVTINDSGSVLPVTGASQSFGTTALPWLNLILADNGGVTLYNTTSENINRLRWTDTIGPLWFDGGLSFGLTHNIQAITANRTVTWLDENITVVGIASAQTLTNKTLTMPALTATAFAALGTPADGSYTYCSDCTKATPCASGGSGAFAKRINGAWDCD